MLQSSTTGIYVLKIHAAVPCIQCWLNPSPQEMANFVFPGQVSGMEAQTSVIPTEKLSASIHPLRSAVWPWMMRDNTAKCCLHLSGA